MRFNVTVDGQIVILALFGDLVTDSAVELIAEVTKHAGERRYFVLDMTSVGFMNSSGLGACMKVHTLLKEKNGLVAFAHLNDIVGRVFSLTRADKKLLVVPSKPEAIGALRERMQGGALGNG